MFQFNLSLVTAMGKHTVFCFVLFFHLNTFQREQILLSDSSSFIVFQPSAKAFISLCFVDFFRMDIFLKVFLCSSHVHCGNSKHKLYDIYCWERQLSDLWYATPCHNSTLGMIWYSCMHNKSRISSASLRIQNNTFYKMAFKKKVNSALSFHCS